MFAASLRKVNMPVPASKNWVQPSARLHMISTSNIVVTECHSCHAKWHFVSRRYGCVWESCVCVSELWVVSCVWIVCVWASCVWVSCVWESCVCVCAWVVSSKLCVSGAAGGGGTDESAQPKTRTPHKDVGNNTRKNIGFTYLSYMLPRNNPTCC